MRRKTLVPGLGIPRRREGAVSGRKAEAKDRKNRQVQRKEPSELAMEQGRRGATATGQGSWRDEDGG